MPQNIWLSVCSEILLYVHIECDVSLMRTLPSIFSTYLGPGCRDSLSRVFIPDVTLLSNHFQLLLWDPEALPGHMRYSSTELPVSSQVVLPRPPLKCTEGILIR